MAGPGGAGLWEFGWGSPFDWQGVEGAGGSETDNRKHSQIVSCISDEHYNLDRDYRS